MHFRVTPAALHDAELTVPGDKSISHRALMLGSIATGRTTVSGFLAGEDCLATRAAMEALGVRIEDAPSGELLVEGVGLDGLRPPRAALDLGNSGTAMRLMTGLLAGQPFETVLTGDESLRRRPMGRVIAPLTEMGADIASQDGRPPLTIRGRPGLSGIDYALPMASAQVKSAILLAGLYASGSTRVCEPAATRDHTERMLLAMGAQPVIEGACVSLSAPRELVGCDIEVPADLSSAAFVMLGALLAEKADVLIRNVGINPTRTGVITILQQMGADLALENPRKLGEEPVADIRVRSSRLRGSEIGADLVSLAIDEFPVLFVAAAAAQGRSTFAGLGELRVKESDRIAAMADGLRRLGIRVDETPDGASIEGGQFSGGEVASYADHRVAMSLAMAGTIASGPVLIRDVDNVETSFPGFVETVAQVGADIECLEDAP
ncbi:MAG TPA: 3-phosphoshikimate 1-carboxyvinyltransferase [Woeseiaceae bacterium]